MAASVIKQRTIEKFIMSEHPCLLLTQKGIEKIKAQNKPAMLFNTTLTQIKNQIYPILKQPIEVPLPKDAGGGYTHEQHKRIFFFFS